MPDQPTPNSEETSSQPLRLRHWLRTWWSLAWQDRLLVIEALLLLGIARATVLFIPFKRVAPYLGQMQQETPTGIPSASARRIGRAIYLVSRYTPWKSNCFAQALAGHVMLRRRRAPNTLYLGVHKQGELFTAHAWLRNGDLVVTGGGGHERYTVIARYGWSGPKGS